VSEVLLLDADGKVLGGATFSVENNAWTPLVSFVKCGVCKSCDAVGNCNDCGDCEICDEKNGNYEYKVFDISSDLVYTETNGTIIITGITRGVRFGEVKIPAEINKLPVRRIEAFAFENALMDSITIPGSVTSIGWAAFTGSQIQEVTFEEYSGCGIKDADGNILVGKCEDCRACMINVLLAIDMAAFSNTPRLTSISLENVTSLNMLAFQNSGLTSVDLGTWIHEIPGGAFWGTALTSVTIPGQVKTIGASAFRDIPTLEKVEIEEGVQNIGDFAFAGASLTSVSLPDSVEQISINSFDLETLAELDEILSVFYQFFNIEPDENGFLIREGSLILYFGDEENIIIPGNVTRINSNAFQNTGIKSVLIHDNVVEIAPSAFSECTNLESIIVAGDNPNAVYFSDDGVLFRRSENVIGTTLVAFPPGRGGHYQIPSHATHIGDRAFNDSHLTTITLPNSVTNIGIGVFSRVSLRSITINMTNITAMGLRSIDTLETLIIGDNVRAIENSAFAYAGFRNVTIGNNVEIIGNSAFSQMPRLTTISIPNSVVDIGRNSFDGTPLTNVTVDMTNIDTRAFSSLSTLERLTIGENVRRIGDWAFTNIGLVNVTIGNSVETIGFSAFRGNSNLTAISIPDSVIEIGSSAFADSGLVNVTIGNSVEIIDSGAFRGNSNLTAISIPNSVVTISSRAFSDTALTTLSIDMRNINTFAFHDIESLETLVIGDSVERIGNMAFRGNSNLKEIEIPSRVAFIGSNAFADTPLEIVTINMEVINTRAFRNMASLRTLVVGDNVRAIEGGTFEGSGLESVTIGNNVERIGAFAFSNTALTTISIPESVVEIGTSAFSNTELTMISINMRNINTREFNNRPSLETLIIGDSVRIVGGSAFSSSGLESVTIGNNVEIIGEFAFFSNANLTEISIPDSVTHIGDAAFSGNPNLAQVVFNSPTPPEFGSDAVFGFNFQTVRIYVPAGRVRAYESVLNRYPLIFCIECKENDCVCVCNRPGCLVPISECECTQCSICENWNCASGSHIRCGTCGNWDCGITHSLCVVCNRWDCGITHVQCDICSNWDCRTFHVWCSACSSWDCEKPHVRCSVCNSWDCEVLHVQCEICNAWDCPVAHFCHCGALFNDEGNCPLCCPTCGTPFECECPPPLCGNCGRIKLDGHRCTGDVNGDGVLDVNDAIVILRFLTELPNLIGVCSCEVRCCITTQIHECRTIRQCMCNEPCESLVNCSTVLNSAWNAALVTVDNEGNQFSMPRVRDAIVILRTLLDLPSVDSNIIYIWR
jgi:hypothetical protein